MPATFMWVKGLEKAPITVQFTVPDRSWKIATQLPRSDKAFHFTAPNLQYFMDAPTKIGELHVSEWKVTNPDNRTYTMQLALQAQATEGLVDSFTQKLKKIVAEAKAVFGEVPHYDYGQYTFIASLNPYAHGDGMEHRNSTMITSGRVFTGADNFLNTFAHEFFHCWNVERIRPASLEPFDFSKSNMSEALWVAEGFTQYYGLLLMKRAGFTPDSIFNLQMASLINAKENTPGGKYYTPLENSQRAVFVDAGVSIDDTNYPNMFTSYYSYGAALALALDMQLRANFNKTLDGFMQQMWKRFGKTEKPYTMKSMEQLLAEYTSTKFATAFFNNYVFASNSINYKPLMEAAGLQLTQANAGKAWIGAPRFNVRGGDLVIQDVTIRNTPLYAAGADVNDVLISLGDAPMHSAADVDNFLKSHKPGDVVNISYKHRDETISRTIAISENPAFTLQTSPDASSAQRRFYSEWTRTHAR
jgi:predicted metalloprotease with PDZ domain